MNASKHGRNAVVTLVCIVSFVVQPAVGQTTRPDEQPNPSMVAALKELAGNKPYSLVELLERHGHSASIHTAVRGLLSDLGMRGTVALLRRAEHNRRLLPHLAKLMQRPAVESFESLRTALWEAPGFEEALRVDDVAQGGAVPNDSLDAARLAEHVSWTGLAALIPFVTDPNIEVRAQIAAAMARLSHPAGFRILATLLASSDSATVGITLEAIAVALPPGAREAAEPFLDADDEARVGGAVAVLAALNAPIDPERGRNGLTLLRPPLTEALMDAMRRHPNADRLPALLVDALTVDEVRDPIWVAREAIREGQRHAPGFAESLIHHSNWALRAAALNAVALGAMVSLRDVTARLATFESSARDDSPWVRWASARGLGTVPDPVARATLVVLLGDTFSPVREEAAHALAFQAPRDATPPLRRAATGDQDHGVRNAARIALLKIGVVIDLPAIIDDAEDEFLGPRTRGFLTEWLGFGIPTDRAQLEAAIRGRAARK